MDLMWFMLGGLTVGIAWGLRAWIGKKRLKLSWRSWSGIALDVFLVIFTLAWSLSSIEEGESQAAGMGLLLIGGCALVVFALARKVVLKDMETAPEVSAG